MKKRLLSAILLAGALLSACGSDSDVASTNANNNEDAKKVVIGTGSQFINICFYDEDGNLTGYDIELLKEIDQRLPQYEFDFEVMDFSNLLLSLETKKIDVIAHNMAKNPEREEKFLFNSQPYNAVPTHVVVNEKNTDIQSIDDLNGKTVGLAPTSNAALFVEDYVAKNNMDTKLTYITSTPDILNQLKTDRIQAIFQFPFSVEIFNRESDAQLKLVGEPLIFSEIFFMLNKQDEQLAADIDEVLVELIDDGTVKELSEKWLGADFSVEL
ncbi:MULTISPECIES: transporter substrate-binding domain-containing protein [Solibacillus]|uniref:Transporter substrate-binding domain-containing protein n=1 Tax=Solibacillus merdavium TaxID=2762218 RepID=A0ABR8XRJ7_9BACL|nr:transporter substrate-binding domain-containing protein [Solibacillus merdavium]MBD8034572.1 transporter substrate-binding domain-containing protein [Solibacillus merdavium]